MTQMKTFQNSLQLNCFVYILILLFWDLRTLYVYFLFIYFFLYMLVK